MLRACVINLQGSWDLNGRKCRSPIHWHEVGERKLLGPKIVQQTADVVKKIRQCMHIAQNR